MIYRVWEPTHPESKAKEFNVALATEAAELYAEQVFALDDGPADFAHITVYVAWDKDDVVNGRCVEITVDVSFVAQFDAVLEKEIR